MGSERVFGGVGVRELEAGRESNRVSADRNKPLVIQKGGTGDVADPRCASRGSSAPCVRQGSQLNDLTVENVFERPNFRKGDLGRLVSSRSDDLQFSSKCKKLSKNGSECSKRPLLAQMEDSRSPISDKRQIHKQRTYCGGKRCDERKGSTRTKYDSFSIKNGMTSFNSSSAGHTVLGYYGLKPDLHDITKQVNELSLTDHSLDELLDDTLPCQFVGKGRSNNTPHTNENIVQTIKTVCLILSPQRPSQVHAFSEMEGNLINKVSPSMPSASCVPGSLKNDRRDSSVIEQFPHNKEPCSRPDGPVSAADFPLYHPSAVLERLGLHPPENLESLLSGDARPLVSTRDGFDSRSGKRFATQPYLPPFSWSHTFSGNCKSTADALKLSTSRSPCQGSRWARIGNTASFCGVASNDFTDFTKLSYDQNLVPHAELESVILPSGGTGCFPQPTLVTLDSRAPNTTRDEHPPSLIIAAQTLCNLATQSMPPDLSQILRRPRKKLLEKALKAQKFKHEERFERPFSRPKSLLGYDSLARQTDQEMPAKKAKLTSTDKKKDVTPTNIGMAKGPLIWSGPKSCRSSSYRSVKETKSEIKQCSTDLNHIKPPIGLSPVRIIDKGSNSQRKPRKVVQVYWDR